MRDDGPIVKEVTAAAQSVIADVQLLGQARDSVPVYGSGYRRG